MKLIFATALLLFTTSHALAEKPRIYTAHPIETASAYSQRALDAYTAGTWTVTELEDSSTHDPAHTQRSYESALRAFTEAIAAEPSMYEAHSYLGYVSRKLGRYQDALHAYEAALKLKPDYVYAIEYQGETFLALDDFERARFNYLRLYALDQALASKLLDAMRAWSTSRSASDDARFAAAIDWIEAQSSRSP